MFAKNRHKSTVLLLLLLVFSIIVAYYPSLTVPFYLDDRESIVSNLMIQSESLDLLINSWMRMRIIGYFTLWANYQYGGLDVTGYHIVNIAIHIINSLLVFILSLQLIRHFTPADDNDIRTQQILWAVVIAAIWALHPLNSQAVTYVVQRLASIASLFYLLSIISYIKVRQQQVSLKAVVYGLLFIGCLIAGFHAKQNFATVLVFLFCWELLTCTATIRRYLLALTATGIFALLIISPFIDSFWLALDSFTRDPNASTRGDYFYTQLIVLWDYIGRFVYPISLQLNIYIPLRTSFEPLVALALVAHILFIGISFKYRQKVPLLFTGVLLFYTSHLVESSIIPIKDLAFEHRTYIGNFGLILSVIALLQFCLTKLDKQSRQVNTRRVIIGLCIIMLFSLAGTYKRNLLWQTPLDFYANEVELAPEQARANAAYGIELMKLKRYEEAELYLRKSVDINLARQQVTASGLTAYMTVLYHQKKYQQAASVVMVGLKYIKYHIDRSTLLGNLAYGYIQMGYCDFAKGLLTKALSLNSKNEGARANLEYCLAQLQTADG